MPKVKYTPAKGLHQVSGDSVNLGHSVVTDGSTLGGATNGVAVHTIAVSGTDTITLPTNATAGDVHIIVVKSAASTPKITLTSTTPAMSAVSVAAGDFIICVYDGSAWVRGSAIA